MGLILIGLLAFLFLLFERRRVSAEKIVLIAILSAVSAVGRGLFAAIPSVQPSSFIIIMTGLVMGMEAGFMTGALTALLSAFMLGLGPWTPWQMFAWGMMGVGAGLLKNPLLKYKGVRILYGALWGFLYGWIMNLWMIITVTQPETGIAYLIGVYAASFPFDLMHAAANVFLITLGGDVFIRTLSRIAVKYGLRPVS